MMPRCLAFLLLAATSCTAMAKVYRTEPLLPDGEPVPQLRRDLGNAVISLTGLDISVEGERTELALWISPLLLPPVIPLPAPGFDPNGNATVYLQLHPTRAGYTLSLASIRLRIDGGASVAASTWSGGPLVGGAIQERTHAPGDRIKIDADLVIQIVFPTASPLEDTAELQIEGLEFEGTAVELPPLFLRPTYKVEDVPLS